MRLINQRILIKLKKKNVGNVRLLEAIDDLINDLERNSFKTFAELKVVRRDADKVHADGFCFFNINVHRTMVMIEFGEDEATVIWGGSHDEYDRTFQNNRGTIQNWLKANGYLG